MHQRAHWAENVPLNPGATNTVRIEKVATDHLSLAAPHRAARALSPADRSRLPAFLNSLDQASAAIPVGLIFRDGFESGDTSNWRP